jgi:hypothetical protein
VVTDGKRHTATSFALNLDWEANRLGVSLLAQKRVAYKNVASVLESFKVVGRGKYFSRKGA